MGSARAAFPMTELSEPSCLNASGQQMPLDLARRINNKVAKKAGHGGLSRASE